MGMEWTRAFQALSRRVASSVDWRLETGVQLAPRPLALQKSKTVKVPISPIRVMTGLLTSENARQASTHKAPVQDRLAAPHPHLGAVPITIIAISGHF